MQSNVFEYIKTEENNFKTVRIPLTKSKDWNMHEHIERCYNVANGWFHQGANDGNRPYDDIVTPIIDFAFRSEGFDVKDIVPFVDDAEQYYKSFIIKKRHPQWARENEIDTFIDDVVETSIIYDLALIKQINNIRPEVVDLRTIAFCDQTDVMAGPICIKHNYTPAELVEMKGKWDSDAIDMAIALAGQNKKVSIAGDQEAKTPNKNIEVYELRGNLPELWIDENGELNKFVNQMHIVSFYIDETGEKQGLSFYQGEDKPLSDNFKALKIDRIRSKGRACGRSIVERLFEPQVWRNYSAIKLKKLMDAALTVFVTDSIEFRNQKLSNVKENTILGVEKGAMVNKVDGTPQNTQLFNNDMVKQENSARLLGSANEANLGLNPTSGTPFALQNLVVQEGKGMHEYRQGKIATFFADVLYRDWILEWLIKDLNAGKKFSEVLNLKELQEVADTIITNAVNKQKAEIMFANGVVNEAEMQVLEETLRQEFMKDSRKFFETFKGDFANTPTKVFVNIKGKQRYMAQNADKITNIIREVLRNPQAFTQTPGIGDAVNQLLEESGMRPIDFTSMINSVKTQPVQSGAFKPELANQVGGEQLTK